MSNPLDNKHIQEVLDGKTSSFTFLVDSYKNMVYTVCYRILRNHHDAEDAAQNSFIKAYKSLHAYSGKAKFSTWLYTIAYRTAISVSRIKNYDIVNEDFLLDNAQEPSTPSSGNLEAKDKKLFVGKAIEQLPEIDGVLITLFYIDDCSIQEIVDITGLTESNIKVKLHRARKMLKSSLKEMLHEEMESMR